MFSGRFEVLVLRGVEVWLLEDERGGWRFASCAPVSITGRGAGREDAMVAFLRQLEARNVIEQLDFGRLETLSPRQKQVLVLTAEGKDQKQVAEHLGVAQKTVESFVNGINKKLGTKSRLQAVVFYYQARLRDLNKE